MSNGFTDRKNIRNLLDDEIELMRFRYKRIMDIEDNRGYIHLAGYHGTPNW